MIQVLSLSAAVRKRPGMYIGSTDDGRGPLHLLLAVVANAIEQVLLGRCTRVEVGVEADDFVTVTDDGPGIPAHALVDLVERLQNRSAEDNDRRHVHLGYRGLGLPIVSALSDPFEVDTVHAGEQATVTYAGGAQRIPLQVSAGSRPSGTRVRFRPDPQIFQGTRVPRVELTQRLEDLAFLLPARALSWRFAGEGLPGLVARVHAEVHEPLDDIAHYQGEYETEDGPTAVEVVVSWRTQSPASPAQLLGFVNLQRKADGPHVSGMLAGVRDFLKLRSDRELDGLVAAVAVLYSEARYVRQTMLSLASSRLRTVVKEATLTALQQWAGRCPEAAAALRRRVKA